MEETRGALTRQSDPARKTEPALDLAALRAHFPILSRPVHGRRLVYLDNAATTQKPQAVIDAISGYYAKYNANVHRGIHTLAEEATAAYEATRGRVARLLGETNTRQVVFTRNTTESINLVASAWGERHIGEGDEILLTQMEHHSNLVPWILLARKKGARLRHIPITDDGRLDLSTLDDLLTKRTRLVSLAHKSNVLGTINPVAEVAERAHRLGAVVMVDAAQSVPHLPVQVEQLGVDFLAFSAHKMLGPTGVGVLWGRAELLEAMDPYMGGGEMIREVTLDSATWNDIPWKFEAGTPNIADVVAFSTAINYLMHLGMENVRRHEIELTQYALERLRSLGHITIYGPPAAEERSGVVAFNDADIHPHDLSTILDHHGVAVRAGHHCAQPLMRRLGVVATARASFYVYNDTDDVDVLIEALKEARRYFGFADRTPG
jgi:cysteine desulfurase/selenocysteine lyase